jgi:hypothetical protein
VKEVRLEEMLGRRVLSREGRPVGRLEEACAEEREGAWVVLEFLVGTAALLQRLSASFFPLLGLRVTGYRVRWDQLDLGDPKRPRLTCDVAELQTFDTGRRMGGRSPQDRGFSRGEG